MGQIISAHLTSIMSLASCSWVKPISCTKRLVTGYETICCWSNLWQDIYSFKVFHTSIFHTQRNLIHTNVNTTFKSYGIHPLVEIPGDGGIYPPYFLTRGMAYTNTPTPHPPLSKILQNNMVILFLVIKLITFKCYDIKCKTLLITVKKNPICLAHLG